MDFATNYSHHRQDEIHGAFWCRNQTTLHPIVVYYPCPEKCGHLVRDGAIGCLSMHIDAVVRSGSHEFGDASEIVRYCELKLTVDNDKS